MTDPLKISAQDFRYDLPEDRISQYPLADRDLSKLLIYKNGEISRDIFGNITNHLPCNSLMIVNNTRVVHARLNFIKPTGARVEIFCLEPLSPVVEMQQAFSQRSPVIWNCLTGNAKRWKGSQLSAEFFHQGSRVVLTSERLSPGSNPGPVRFSWSPEELPFSQVIADFGKVPLPPYIHRDPEASDNIRYQTIFAVSDGSVAAPTAGLHFTEVVLNQLKQKNISVREVTLHVGSGTFAPITSSDVFAHVMHPEEIHVKKELIRAVMDHPGPLIAIGTTTVRTLESLYWLGVKLIRRQAPLGPMLVDQWESYSDQDNTRFTLRESFEALMDHMEKNNLERISGQTRLMIIPGYRYRAVDIMITNFHQPGSTLLLLVAAFIGNAWQKAYSFALEHDFRFLSYGDSCLFFKEAETE
jgi:S-adenosylmethionine:tRNA ribosyltransferase-isomerase